MRTQCIIGLLTKNPKLRPTIKDVLEDPWIAETSPATDTRKDRPFAHTSPDFQLFSIPEPNSPTAQDSAPGVSKEGQST
jgi:hypothetical protein